MAGGHSIRATRGDTSESNEDGRVVARHKVRKLLKRQGVLVTYATLHRFAVLELAFGRRAATVPVADC